MYKHWTLKCLSQGNIYSPNLPWASWGCCYFAWMYSRIKVGQPWMLAFKKNWHTPTEINWNWAQFQKVQLNPCILFLLMYLQARELWPQPYSLTLPLDWSQVTHIPTSTKNRQGLQGQKVIFLHYLCQRTVRWHLSSWMALSLSTCSQTFKCTLAYFAHTNSQVLITFSELENLFSILVLEEFRVLPKAGHCAMLRKYSVTTQV